MEIFRRLKSGPLVLMTVLLIAALMTGVPASAAGAEKTGRDRPLVLAVHPYLIPSELVERFAPIAGYLSAKTGRKVVVDISKDYASHIARVGKGEVDLAFMGPASYVELVDQYGPFEILSGLEVEGKRSFRGVVIKRASSDIASLGDLKGKSFAFGDPESTMSHLVPRYMLIKAGVGSGDLGRFEHLGSHDNVALGVLIGDFDAGAVKEETFHKYEDRGLAVLAWSPEIAEHVFVARKGLDEDLVAKLRSAMTGLAGEPAGPGILHAIKSEVTALVPVKDQEFESLRDVLRVLRKAGVIK